MNLGGPEILIGLLVIALLFGSTKLPKLARSLGSAKGEFEKGIKEGEKLAAEPKKEEEVAVAEAEAVEGKAAEAPKDTTTES